MRPGGGLPRFLIAFKSLAANVQRPSKAGLGVGVRKQAEIALSAVCVIGSAISGAEASPSSSGVQLVDYGVICAVEMTGHRDAPLTESGQLNLIEQGREMDITSTVVPAQIGISFGIRAEVLEATSGTARVIVTHPPLGARGVTVESWSTPLSQGRPVLNLFSFEHAYELVTGDWTFQLSLDGKMVIDQSFVVVPPGLAPDVMETCFPDVPMS